MPHGMCLLWRQDLLLLHVLSDAVIAISYYSIPITLIYFALKRRELRFRWVFALFGLFIMACGTTHLMEIWTIWRPDYRAEGWIKAVTALASASTAVVLWALVPELLRIPSPSALELANLRLQEEIIERTRHERQVTLLNEQLEKRVEERTQSLSAVNDLLRLEILERKEAENSLQDRDRRKDEFLATLAHELRNPLAPIRNAIELLKLQPNQLETARQLINRQLVQLTRLVDDLLDVARITHGQIKLRKSTVDLSDIVVQAVENVRPTIDARQQALTLSLPKDLLLLEADHVRLIQVVTNLLDNATKYTGQNGHITLSLKRIGNEACIEVLDDGIGITPAKLESIFEPFTQADRKANLAQAGLGLGLTLVRRLLEMHGGSVRAVSEGPGAGSRFIVTLPLKPLAHQEPLPAQEGNHDFHPQRILVVDDNHDSADSLKILLQATGHQVHVEYNGSSALEAAEAFDPTVAIVDIGMGEMNGYEVAEAIRRKHPAHSLLLIALTGYGQEDDLLRSTKAGFDYHFLKPVDLDTLSSVLASS